MLTVIRYIHNNPVKAGLVRESQQYRWSSIHAYYGGRGYYDGLTEPEFILSVINEDPNKAILSFRDFMNMDNEDKCLDDQVRLRKTDQEIKAEIESLMNGEPIGRLSSMERSARNEIIRRIKQRDGISLRQIARVTGLSVDIVYNA